MIGACMLVVPPVCDPLPQPRSFKLLSGVLDSSFLRVVHGFGWRLVDVLFHLASNRGSYCTPTTFAWIYLYIEIYRYIFCPICIQKQCHCGFDSWKTEALFLHLEDKKESKIMVISLKSFLEDFVTITWIVHAVQRRATKKQKEVKKSFKDRSQSHTHRQKMCLCVCVCVCACVCQRERQTVNEQSTCCR